MADQLEQLLKRIANEQGLLHGVEEVTRQGAVLPLLAQLGWDVYNINEVAPEFAVEGGRVDYCLRRGERNLVFIEVKRTTEDLEGHARQLLEYAFKHGVSMAALTNGLLWWFYLPLSEGSWEQRKFFAIDIKLQPTASVAAHFRDFLGRDSITGGAALTKAKSLQAGKERESLLLRAVPQVWNQMLVQPDEDLLELLADKVESACGHRPDPELLLEHLRAGTSPVFPKVNARSETEPRVTESQAAKQPERGFRQKGATIRTGNHQIVANSVSELYRLVLKYLCDSGQIDTFNKNIPYATSGVRYLIARKPLHQGGNSFRNPVEHAGYFMEAHKDYANALRQLKDFLSLGGLIVSYDIR